MSRVVILGAGVSKPAGYPLASELLPEMDRRAERSSWGTAWNEWQAFVNALPTEFELIRSCTNPEVLLSLADLFDLAAEQQDHDRMRIAFGDIEQTGAFDRDTLQKYHDSTSRVLATDMRVGLARFRTALDGFFFFRHADDYHQAPERRAYLRRLLAGLSRGDGVLTFNWDTLVERTLQEDGRWSPADGYGFQRTLELKLPLADRGPYSAPPSDVIVLKLHGSFGWRQLPTKFFLDERSFLHNFDFRVQEKHIALRDVDEPSVYRPSDPILMYPSFLKKLAQPIIGEVWRRAAEQLANAEHAEVIGYSLPQSDLAARTLFMGLALRSRAGQAQVVVRDRSAATLDRWRELLGEKAEYREEEIPAKPSMATRRSHPRRRGRARYDSAPRGSRS